MQVEPTRRVVIDETLMTTKLTRLIDRHRRRHWLRAGATMGRLGARTLHCRIAQQLIFARKVFINHCLVRRLIKGTIPVCHVR
jgi:hypothetical protein